ncbi:hypothetical protein [Ruminococcus sp. XPD3002]|uniref:hypothetical protein n=1 Tax=Ruminococcus sp. XPD3002 TaxID=1452269 RepID=UPI0009157B4C|nr:hypothetical protein SAMN04487832_10562 [Ruminococcus flavefaciens]
MSDDRNKDLIKIISCIFGKKHTGINKEKKQVIIAGDKRADKCSFLGTDKEHYICLIKLTFLIEETTFVDKNFNICKEFDRNTAIDNAIKYLKSLGIDIKCNLYCKSERKLLARFIYQILEEIMTVMFSFGKDFNKEQYEKNLKRISERYHREIVSNGIISSIYRNTKWSDVELYKENDNCNECLLIDIGSYWKRIFFIPHVKTGIYISINSDDNTISNSNLSISHECSKLYILNNKPIIERNTEFCYLDFFHIDNEYYVPNKFCYSTNVNSTQMNIYSNEEVHRGFQEIYDIGKEYTDQSLHRDTMEIKKVIDYLKKEYCSDKKKQYVNILSVLSEIISSLLKINYLTFYSEKYKFSNTVFKIGFEQLTYFFEDNNIKYSEKEVGVIFKYLVSEWIKSFPWYLKNFDFKEMFKYYETKEDKEYANNIDHYRKTISKFDTFNIFDSAYDHYKDFCNKNEKLIEAFNSAFRIDIIKPYSPLDDLFDSIDTDQFTQLKKAIKEFQEKLNWRVHYYSRITFTDGRSKYTCVDKHLGYGQVGEKKNIIHKQYEQFTVEGPDSITLGFGENIAEIKYILKPEYTSEQPNENTNQNYSESVNAGLILKKNQKYHIEFEASGTDNAPFSFFIIRRTKDKAFEMVFDKDDIELRPKFKKYSFDFTYNGETEDFCYLVYGYGNMRGGYKIQNVKVSEIE